MKNPHIHEPNDGRGGRNVFVDGMLVRRVLFADTKRGIVRVAAHDPIRLDKHRKRILTRTLRGKVTVEPIT